MPEQAPAVDSKQGKKGYFRGEKASESDAGTRPTVKPSADIGDPNHEQQRTQERDHSIRVSVRENH
ncbi:MAG: hypothetical protein IPJ48_19735 [Propionivibrio sp.]|uniref:Uncharacterized protein n=1 Tax=Candidatus Propionivibrio dominans TaxID=2954373 RepID=A0A9D7FI06_9RHOO|nr:hypothetical protein [Candidatus Propionivibrio dominans]